MGLFRARTTEVLSLSGTRRIKNETLKLIVSFTTHFGVYRSKELLCVVERLLPQSYTPSFRLRLVISDGGRCLVSSVDQSLQRVSGSSSLKIIEVKYLFF